ncbi:hypothetical protein N9M08_04600 [Porticoccaceae bacterium]|nr:hypothetical protein [Porticoccaceae bacterium]
MFMRSVGYLRNFKVSVIALLWMLLIYPLTAICQEESVRDELDRLQQIIDAQELRIKRLEALLASPKQRRTVIDRYSWQNEVLWQRIELGMSRLQVESLLGQPSSEKRDIAKWLTLYYQGEKAGAGFISGNVVLNKDDRVEMINIPVM